MLESLHIENIAVIENTDINFTDGLNILTGETGAGKSIVIDSINAILGERTSKDLIRTGCDKGEVSAVFSSLSEHSINVLMENGFETDDEGKLFIHRRLSSTGAGLIKINGKTATASILREIGKSLINIHGQHDNQSLLIPENHYIYIDRIAENKDILDEYYCEFKHLNAVRRELSSIETDEGEKARKIELLEYQVKELEEADISLGESDELRKRLSVVENLEKTLSSLNEAYYYISGTDDSDGAFSLIRNAQKSVSTLTGENFEEIQNDFGEILASLDNVSAKIRGFTSGDEYSSANPEELRARLDLIGRMSLKYGGSEQAVIDFLADAKKQLQNIALSDERIKKLSEELDLSTDRLIKKAEKLTKSRVLASKEFSEKVTKTLSFLNMPDVDFKVNISSGRYTKLGCDNIEFMICTNAGDTIKPLSKIASGGELSRVMLSIKSVLADKDDVDTLIFDEIDSGISGNAAVKVGTKLMSVSKSRQVGCVTHLAQIAAFADNHLLIEKQVKDNKTYTGVSLLGYNERIFEIARIMSGGEVTDNLYNSAKELLDRSREENANL